MSYLVQIWDASRVDTRPAGVKEAVAQVKALHQEQPGTNPKFVTLVQSLTQRYPDLADVLAEGDDAADCAWSDGPLDGRTESGVLTLGLNVALLEEVRPFVIEQARLLDLSVLDEQAGEAWLPDGSVLRLAQMVSGPAPEAADDDEPPKAREVLNIVFEHLKPKLVAQGYTARKRDHSFILHYAHGWHEISLDSSDFWPVCVMFNVTACSRYHAVAELIHATIYAESPPENTAEQHTICFPQSKWMGKDHFPFLGVGQSYKIYRREALDASIAHLMKQLDERIFPRLKNCETLEGLAEIVFEEPVSHSDYGWENGGATAIMLAYLMNSPDLDTICETLLKRHEKHVYELKGTKSCIDYVRSHPLKNA